MTDASARALLCDARMHHPRASTAAASLMFIVVAVGASAKPARAADTVSTPFAGGTLKHHTDGTQDLWVLHVDLCAAGVSLRTTGENEKGRTVPSWSNLVGASAAVNGDFFDNAHGFSTDGLARHGGADWSNQGA